MQHDKGFSRQTTAAGWVLTGFLVIALPLPGCVDGSAPTVLTADLPLHLEDQLDVAIIEGSEPPRDIPAPVEWLFDRPQPDWKPVVPLLSSVEPVQLTRTEDALRVTLTEKGVGPGTQPHGGIYVDVPNWRLDDWGSIVVRARTSDQVDHLEIEHNLRKEVGSEGENWPFLFDGEESIVVNDGTERSYLLRADWTWQKWESPWQHLGLEMGFDEPGSIDILSVSLVPKEARYVAAPAGVTMESRAEKHRSALNMHTPGKLKYRVRVPDSGHLDVNLGVLRQDTPVTFSITATPDGEKARVLLEETYTDRERWGHRSVDLSSMSGEVVTLSLEVDSDRAGTVALWGSPTLTGKRVTDKPNVILYVIDAGGADFMSVYGYNRRTTPNLERIAAEGALFEHAYSNSTWSKPSTASFMTSLHHSVLGGYGNDSDPLPDQAVTMAQRLRASGYQTAVIVSNPFAATLSPGLERGVDLLRDAGVKPNSMSSTQLHDDFWNWREEFPGEPYWVHFQTTDVHSPYRPEPPFSGFFISPERRRQFLEWQNRLRQESGPMLARFEKTGIDRRSYAEAQRSLYDEVLAHQDYQLGQLVERLRATGEWERTLLIVAADHGYVAAGWRVLDPLAPGWAPMFNSHMTRIPLVVVWPGQISPGQRFRDPVSMIDVLPTILDLTDLPAPEVMQGQSLAPLLLGKTGWELRPVIFDEFDVDRQTGELRGSLEMIDGTWGASLQINPDPEEEGSQTGGEASADRRPAPLLLYNVRNDPFCLRSLHEERPDLVEKYTRLLEAQWEAHQVLAQRFSRSREAALSPEQLQTLRSLGYIQ